MENKINLPSFTAHETIIPQQAFQLGGIGPRIIKNIKPRVVEISAYDCAALGLELKIEDIAKCETGLKCYNRFLNKSVCIESLESLND